MSKNKIRCGWVNDEQIYIDYHDQEWGKPLYDDEKLFELLILEGMQAGLSWITVLKKRDNYRLAFDGFDAEKIARYNQKKFDSLLTNPGIIRNRLKIKAIITNAQAYLDIKKEWPSFAEYLWQFVDGKTRQNNWESIKNVPATSLDSDEMSKDLKKRGFKFVGSTICYAFMQAAGLINDHTIDCFRHRQVIL